jgi:deoxyribodipyrimidine photo-lyase
MPTINVFWFRRDLRLQDNAVLYHALKSDHPVVPLFIFDRHILDKLDNKADRRVEFIHAALADMQKQLVQMGSTLQVYYDTPIEAFKKLGKQYTIGKVFTNHDYEPYATNRDKTIEQWLKENSISFWCGMRRR